MKPSGSSAAEGGAFAGGSSSQEEADAGLGAASAGSVDAATAADRSVSDGAAGGSRSVASNGDGGAGVQGDASGAIDAGGSGPGGAWVMGYYSGFGATYPVAEIDWAGLTHLAVAFYLPDAEGNVDTSLSQGSGGPALAESLVSAAHAAGKKIVASFGGAGSESSWQGATAPANRAALENNIGSVVSTYGYDGVDIDWEPLAVGDHAALQALVQDLRAQLPGVSITLPVDCENNNAPDDLTFFGQIAGSVDRMNLMSYGLSGAWSGWKSWHSSPLHWNGDPSTPIAIDSTVNDYVNAGVPAEKLGVGSGFYGECYTSPVTAPDQALGGSMVAAADGTMSYANIMAGYYDAGTYHWDDGAMVPYLSFDAAQGSEACTYVTYEDAQAIAAKAAYVRSMGLGGMILWTINEGYVSTAPAGARNPLLDAVRTAFSL